MAHVQTGDATQASRYACLAARAGQLLRELAAAQHNSGEFSVRSYLVLRFYISPAERCCCVVGSSWVLASQLAVCAGYWSRLAPTQKQLLQG